MWYVLVDDDYMAAWLQDDDWRKLQLSYQSRISVAHLFMIQLNTVAETRGGISWQLNGQNIPSALPVSGQQTTGTRLHWTQDGCPILCKFTCCHSDVDIESTRSNLRARPSYKNLQHFGKCTYSLYCRGTTSASVGNNENGKCLCQPALRLQLLKMLHCSFTSIM